MFSVSITHHSKIKELSDENRVMETEWWWCQTDLSQWVSLFLSFELWRENWVMEIGHPNTPSVPRSFFSPSPAPIWSLLWYVFFLILSLIPNHPCFYWFGLFISCYGMSSSWFCFSHPKMLDVFLGNQTGYIIYVRGIWVKKKMNDFVFFRFLMLLFFLVVWIWIWG